MDSGSRLCRRVRNDRLAPTAYRLPFTVHRSPIMPDKILIRIDEHGNATVMLNRPEVHNAFDPEMVEELTAAFETLGMDANVRAIVVLGAGESFCAGADIRHMKASAKFSRKQNYEAALQSARMLHTVYACP